MAQTFNNGEQLGTIRGILNGNANEINILQASKAPLSSLADGSGSSLIGYNEGETGAVNRILTARLQDYVSVKDFGAVGDGTTNDTAAFAAAFAASKYVYVPEGTYLASVNLPRAGSLVGAGNGIFASRSATILVAPAGSGYAVQIDATTEVKQMCKVENISILNTINDATNVGINIKGSTVASENDLHNFNNLTIRNYATSIKVRGRMIYSNWNNVFCSGGLVAATGLTNIHLDSQTDPSDVSFNLNMFTSCQFIGAKAQGVKITGQNVTNTFQNCDISGNNADNVAGVAAFYIEDSRELKIDGCYFEGNGTGVAVDNSTISNNSIDIHFSCGASSASHYTPLITNCWFFQGNICVWMGKTDSTSASPGVFMRGGEISNCLLYPDTNGYAVYSSTSELNPNDPAFVLDGNNVINGNVVVLRDANGVYPCIARQQNDAQNFTLTSTLGAVSPMSRTLVVTPDGSGTDLTFRYLLGGMNFTIQNASSSYALVMDSAMFYSNASVSSNFTIPPLCTRQYVVIGSFGSPSYCLLEVGPPIRTTSAPPIRGYFFRGDLIDNINLSAAGFVGYATVTSGGAAEAARANSTAYTKGQWISIGATVCECVAAGTTGGSAPSTPTTVGQIVTDGSVTWKCRALTTAVLKTYGAISA